MNRLDKALYDFAVMFDRLGIDYAVMGGLAVRVYGIPRPTHDVDITAAVDRRRLPEVYARVEELGYSIPESYASGWIDHVAEMPLVKFRLYMEEGYGVDIDVFLAESKFQQEILARRRPTMLEGATIWLVSPEDLILLKLLANRPRDIADIGDILFMQGQLDQGYLRIWAERLGVLERLESVLLKPT